MTLSKAEQAVVIERRRKRKALPGMKREALFRLKQAVTRALECSLSQERKAPYERAERATQ